MKCPECGVQVSGDEKFCGNCGAPLKPDEPTPPEEQPEMPTGDETVMSAPLPSPSPVEPVEPPRSLGHPPAPESSFTPPPPPPPPPPVARRKNNRKVWIIVAIVLAVLVICCCCIGVTVALLGSEAGEDLMRELDISVIVPTLMALV